MHVCTLRMVAVLKYQKDIKDAEFCEGFAREYDGTKSKGSAGPVIIQPCK